MAYELQGRVILTNLFTDPSFETSGKWSSLVNCTVTYDTT